MSPTNIWKKRWWQAWAYLTYQAKKTQTRFLSGTWYLPNDHLSRDRWNLQHKKTLKRSLLTTAIRTWLCQARRWYFSTRMRSRESWRRSTKLRRLFMRKTTSRMDTRLRTAPKKAKSLHKQWHGNPHQRITPTYKQQTQPSIKKT